MKEGICEEQAAREQVSLHLHYVRSKRWDTAILKSCLYLGDLFIFFPLCVLHFWSQKHVSQWLHIIRTQTQVITTCSTSGRKTNGEEGKIRVSLGHLSFLLFPFLFMCACSFFPINP